MTTLFPSFVPDAKDANGTVQDHAYFKSNRRRTIRSRLATPEEWAAQAAGWAAFASHNAEWVPKSTLTAFVKRHPNGTIKILRFMIHPTAIIFRNGGEADLLEFMDHLEREELSTSEGGEA